MDEFSDFLNDKITLFDLRNECQEIIKRIDSDQLKAIHIMIKNF